MLAGSLWSFVGGLRSFAAGLRLFTGSLWSFAGSLKSFAGDLLRSFVVICGRFWSLPVLVPYYIWPTRLTESCINLFFILYL